MRRGWRGRLPLAILLAALACAPAALAHANLSSSDPAAGARLAHAPLEVTVRLTEAVETRGATLQVTNSSGARVDDGDLRVTPGDQPVLRVGMQPGLPDGVYTVAWHVLSGDGHTVDGLYTFAVGAFDAPPPAAPDDPNRGAEAGLARFLGYAGLALALGAAAFLAWVLPGRAQAPDLLLARLLQAGAAAHFAGMLLLLRFTSAASGIPLDDLAHTTVGSNLLTRVALAAAAVVLALGAVRSRPARALAALLLCGNILLTAMGSHAFKDGPATVALDAVHLASGVLWIGGLVAFLVVAARGPDAGVPTLRRVGERFGTLALACVLLLAATGVLVGLSILGTDAWRRGPAILASPYGQLLAAKVGLWVVMVALAGVNRYVFLAPATHTGAAGALQRAAHAASGGRLRPLEQEPRPFRRALAVESAIGVAVLLVAGFLTSLSPPAVAQASSPGPDLALDGAGEEHLVRLSAQPAPAANGASDLVLRIVERASGAPVSTNTCGRDSCVTLSLGAGEGTETRVAAPQPDGTWLVRDVYWTARGNATVRLTLSTATVFQDAILFTIPVR